MHRELEILCDAVKQAGQRVLHLAKEGFETYRKKDRSPVTSADLEANRILQEALMGHFPEDGWLSEESPDNSERLGKKRVWVVDPIDGTKHFMKGIPQYAISVALVENERLIVGVVYNPATQELFSSTRGSGLCLNGTPIQGDHPIGERLSILLNPSRLEKGEFEAYERHATCHPMGSIAYTLALVAAGKADGTLNFDSLHEWDIAAGVLLVQEAGGIAMDSHKKPMSFNQPNTEVHGVIAARPGARESIEFLMNTVAIEEATKKQAGDSS